MPSLLADPSGRRRAISVAGAIVLGLDVGVAAPLPWFFLPAALVVLGAMALVEHLRRRRSSRGAVRPAAEESSASALRRPPTVTRQILRLQTGFESAGVDVAEGLEGRPWNWEIDGDETQDGSFHFDEAAPGSLRESVRSLRPRGFCGYRLVHDSSDAYINTFHAETFARMLHGVLRTNLWCFSGMTVKDEALLLQNGYESSNSPLSAVQTRLLHDLLRQPGLRLVRFCIVGGYGNELKATGNSEEELRSYLGLPARHEAARGAESVLGGADSPPADR